MTAVPIHAQLIVAHRGASADAPENTPAAFRLAWTQDADGIEGDFHLSSDGHVICMHDKTAKRTAGVDRPVGEMTLQALRELDVGSWKSPAFAGERVATLDEVLQLVPADKVFLIELKTGPHIVEPVRRVLETSDVPHEQLRIIAFDADTIAAAKRQIPTVRAYWLTSFRESEEGRGDWRPTVDEVIDTLQRIGADGLDANANLEVLTPAFIERLRSAGFELHVWTVDDPVKARRLAELGVDSITTNAPAVLRAARPPEPPTGESADASAG